MIRFRKPEPIPTIVTVLLVGLMFMLSYWQVERLRWKEALLADIEAAQSAPPLAPPLANPENLEWHNVILQGKFLHAHELYATPRYLKGQLGYAVITPLLLYGKHSTVVLINRGWVPNDRKLPEARLEGNADIPVTVQGVIRSHTLQQGRFVPDNRPQQNQWFWYDLPAMIKAASLSDGSQTLPVLIDATRITDMQGNPIPGAPEPFPLEINIRNDHLGYAITWFLLGVTGIVMFALYYRKTS